MGETVTIGVAISIPPPWAPILDAARAGVRRPAGRVHPGARDAARPDRDRPRPRSTRSRRISPRSPRRTAPFAVHLRGTGTFRPVTEVVFVAVAAGHQRVRAARRRGPAGSADPGAALPVPPARDHRARRADRRARPGLRRARRLRGAVRRSTTSRFYVHGADGRWRPLRDFPLGATAMIRPTMVWVKIVDCDRSTPGTRASRSAAPPVPGVRPLLARPRAVQRGARRPARRRDRLLRLLRRLRARPGRLLDRRLRARLEQPAAVDAVNRFLQQNIPFLDAEQIADSRNTVAIVGLIGLVLHRRRLDRVAAIVAAGDLGATTSSPATCSSGGWSTSRIMVGIGLLLALSLWVQTGINDAVTPLLLWLSPRVVTVGTQETINDRRRGRRRRARAAGQLRARGVAAVRRHPAADAVAATAAVDAAGRGRADRAVARSAGSTSTSARTARPTSSSAARSALLLFLYLFNQLLLYGAALAATSTRGKVVDLAAGPPPGDEALDRRAIDAAKVFGGERASDATRSLTAGFGRPDRPGPTRR